MKHAALALALALALAQLLLLAMLARAATPPAPAPPLNDPAEGRGLAARLRQMAPAEDTEFSGALIIERAGAADVVVPLVARVRITATGWDSAYVARLSNASPALVVHHTTNGPSRYEFSGDTNLAPAREITGALTNHFAGSDFALLDLGVEFLHWPIQVLRTREMRKGRGCHVLESRPAATNLYSIYSRVVSWVDEETLGLLMVEAYDFAGKPLKQFEVRGFKKVAGRWQVKEMELRNRQTKGGTRLEFHFDER